MEKASSWADLWDNGVWTNVQMYFSRASSLGATWTLDVRDWKLSAFFCSAWFACVLVLPLLALLAFWYN